MNRTILRRLFVVSFLALVLGANGSVAAGTTISVNTTSDDLTNNGNCTLREAIRAANTQASVDHCPAGQGADVIIVPSGIYTLTMGVLSIQTDLTLNGAGTNSTIIEGGSQSRIFNVGSPLTATISNVTIQHGQIVGTHGGGIWNYGRLLLRNTVVFSNTASIGGGIDNQGGVLTLIDCMVIGNMGGNPANYSGDAGGINNSDAGVVTLLNSTIANNVSGYNGGGITNDHSTLIIVDSTISGNRATVAGGGIYNNGFSDSPVTLLNSTIASNTVSGFAGGGGITYGGPITIANTIIAGNTTVGGSPDCGATLISQGYNLIGNTAGCAITGTAAGNQLDVSPNLGPLQKNGGNTATHALLAGSPALDGGNPSGCTDATGNILTSDQRYFPRPLDGDGNGTAICDIGAFESFLPKQWVYLPSITR